MLIAPPLRFSRSSYRLLCCEIKCGCLAEWWNIERRAHGQYDRVGSPGKPSPLFPPVTSDQVALPLNFDLRRRNGPHGRHQVAGECWTDCLLGLCIACHYGQQWPQAFFPCRGMVIGLHERSQMSHKSLRNCVGWQRVISKPTHARGNGRYCS